MVEIHNYFDKYYVANNMAVVLVGDIKFDETIKKVNDAFGQVMRKKRWYIQSYQKKKPITKSNC